MKLSFSKLYVAMTAAALLAGCTVVSTDPTEAGVLIDKPILFGRGGMQLEACKQAKSCTILPPGTPAVIQ